MRLFGKFFIRLNFVYLQFNYYNGTIGSFKCRIDILLVLILHCSFFSVVFILFKYCYIFRKVNFIAAITIIHPQHYIDFNLRLSIVVIII